jgi:hypothetical protein
MSAIVPSLVLAHGSNVFESGHASGDHAHAASPVNHAPGDSPSTVEELHEQIEHLEDRLIAHDERMRVTDVVGGIGYIVGISGAAYYYLGARRRKAIS